MLPKSEHYTFIIRNCINLVAGYQMLQKKHPHFSVIQARRGDGE